MRRFLTKLDENGERWLLLVLYTYIVMVIFIEVVRRFGLNFSSIWGEETARYLFIYLVWIGAAAAVRERAHIRIDVIIYFLPPRAQTIVLLIGDVLMGVLAVIIFYLSIGPFVTSIQYGSVIEGLRILRAWFLFAVPFGFALVIFRIVQSILRDVSPTCAPGDRPSSAASCSISHAPHARGMMASARTRLEGGRAAAADAVLFALAVPVWAALGLTALLLLWVSGALPLRSSASRCSTASTRSR
jgi:C4-dicarboxylate transporter, DctQ subunit